nr:immunoglobulin light chain precursor [Seriola quinqueradiata]
MTLVSVLIWTVLWCCFTESRGQVTVRRCGQVGYVVGGSVPISCRTTQVVCVYSNKHGFAWSNKRVGEKPKLVFSGVSPGESGVQGRFQGGESNCALLLPVRGVKRKTEEVYICKGFSVVNSKTVYGGRTKLIVERAPSPTMRVFPPSSEEMQEEKGTVMCLATKGLPIDLTFALKGGGRRRRSMLDGGRSPGVLEKDGRLSWMSTLRIPADQWSKLGSVTCEATQGSQTPLSETLRRDQCSQS